MVLIYSFTGFLGKQSVNEVKPIEKIYDILNIGAGFLVKRSKVFGRPSRHPSDSRFSALPKSETADTFSEFECS